QEEVEHEGEEGDERPADAVLAIETVPDYSIRNGGGTPRGNPHDAAPTGWKARSASASRAMGRRAPSPTPSAAKAVAATSHSRASCPLPSTVRTRRGNGPRKWRVGKRGGRVCGTSA